MSEITQRQQDRTSTLLALYELTNGDRIQRLEPSQLIEPAGIDQVRLAPALHYLYDKGWAASVTNGMTYSITVQGVDEAERLLAPTPNETAELLVVLTQPERERVEAALVEARRQLDAAEGLSLDARLAAEADFHAVSIQLRSPRASRRVVGLLLRHAVAIAESAVGSVLAALLLTL